jgi:hypothetical protein
MSDDKPLRERVMQFMSGRLPGQPIGMHMGTSYLVNDLWRAHEEAIATLRELHAHCEAPDEFMRAAEFVLAKADGK